MTALKQAGGAAAALLIAAIVLVVTLRPGTHSPIEAAWKRLSNRPVRGRLSGLDYRPVAPANEPARPSPIAIAATETLRRPKGLDARARGVALLLAARPNEAVAAFERASASERMSASYWSDLAATELAVAAEHDEPQRLALAFAAADRAAQIDPQSPEALFNRATALEAMNLARPATVAWRRYLAVDSISPWATEAAQHLTELTQPTLTQEWKIAEQRLAAAARENDLATVRSIVTDHRQDTRASCELYVLTDWAEAVQHNDISKAKVRLDLARDVGDALVLLNDERLLADAVAAIDRSDSATKRLIAEAQIAYRTGRTHNTERHVSQALPLFEESARKFRQAGSPMFRMAEYYVANCQTDLGDVDAALASIHAQLLDAPPSYRALHGLLLWQLGTASSRAGRIYEALESYRESLAVFEALHEEIYADYMRTGVITVSAILGRYEEAWRQRVRAFRYISRDGHPRVLQAALESTARAEATAGNWDVASAFYGLSLERELDPSNPALLASAAIWRPLMTYRLGWTSVANRDVEQARAMLRKLKDPAMHATWTRRLMIAEALTIKKNNPRRALELLTEAERGASERHELFDVPEILLERGRIRRVLGQETEAIADFNRALTMSRDRDRDAPEIEFRNSYFAVDESATEELIETLDRRDERADLLIAADQDRARTFRSPGAADPRSIAEKIPPGTVIAHYTSLPDHLIVIRIDEHGEDVIRVPIGRDELQKRVDRLTKEIKDGDDHAARALSRELYDILLGPIHPQPWRDSRLVVVPDEITAGVPFAALLGPDGKYLIETYAIVFAPSAAFYADAVPASPPARALKSVLTVGNPDFDRKLWPDLPTLTESEREAKDVRKIYDNGAELIGPDATRERVLAGLARYSVADIACHAVVDARDPTRSLLLLTPHGNDRGTLYLRDVAGLSIQTHLVVLAACKSSAPAERVAAATRSFALAFLAAGARNAVGTLWGVEDNSTRQLATSMHRLLRQHIQTADALRLAQVSMLRSDDFASRALRSWSGFQLYGAGD